MGEVGAGSTAVEGTRQTGMMSVLGTINCRCKSLKVVEEMKKLRMSRRG